MLYISSRFPAAAPPPESDESEEGAEPDELLLSELLPDEEVPDEVLPDEGLSDEEVPEEVFPHEGLPELLAELLFELLFSEVDGLSVAFASSSDEGDGEGDSGAFVSSGTLLHLLFGCVPSMKYAVTASQPPPASLPVSIQIFTPTTFDGVFNSFSPSVE